MIITTTNCWFIAVSYSLNQCYEYFFHLDEFFLGKFWTTTSAGSSDNQRSFAAKEVQPYKCMNFELLLNITKYWSELFSGQTLALHVEYFL